jgi:pimeloyl-ACP methyl ester carboxylesterase
MALARLRRAWIPSTHSQLMDAQTAVLNHFVKAPLFPRRILLHNGYVVNAVDSQSETNFALKNSSLPQSTLLLLHGFGSGLGFFFNNFDRFLKQPGVGNQFPGHEGLVVNGRFDRVIAVDWAGMGGSSRSSQSKSCASKVRFTDPSAAINFFISSLEEFRISLSLPPSLYLCGHSLGGYLAAHYARMHTSKLQGLILASPVGLSQPPPTEKHIPYHKLDLRLRWFMRAWERDFTPQHLVRALGPKGPGY